jgi:hypothetical protein
VLAHHPTGTALRNPEAFDEHDYGPPATLRDQPRIGRRLVVMVLMRKS